MLDGMPNPTGADEIARWRENRRRYMMQHGNWRTLILQRMSFFFARDVMQRIVSTVDDSLCPFRMANEKKTAIYDVSPTAAAGGKDLRPLNLGVYWPLSQSRHETTVTCNESFVRFDWRKQAVDQYGTGITYRVVEPFWISAEASSIRPDLPHYVEELREYPRPEGGCRWVWEIWDLRRPELPNFRLLSADRRDDLTPAYFASLVAPGGAYERNKDEVVSRRTAFWPYYDRQNRPVMPYRIYHHRVGNTLFDPYTRNELVEGSLLTGCLRTWFLGGMRDLAHPQRVGIDVEIPSMVGVKGGSTNRVTLDASAILMFRGVGGNPSIQTLSPAMDTAKACDAIDRFVATLMEGDGLGSDPNINRGSGYMLVVAQGPLRKVQRQQEPACRQGDTGLMADAARLLNRYQGTDLPERSDEYQVAYHGVELSLEERRARLEEVQIRKGLGLIMDRDALILLDPMLSPEEADRQLAEIAKGSTQRPGALAAPDTLSDPSSGAPLRTPRGVNAPDAEEPAPAQSGENTPETPPKRDVPAKVSPAIPITPTDIAVVVTVNEVRAGLGLPETTDGHLTVAAYKAKYSAVVAEAANAEAGSTTKPQPAEPAPQT